MSDEPTESRTDHALSPAKRAAARLRICRGDDTHPRCPHWVHGACFWAAGLDFDVWIRKPESRCPDERWGVSDDDERRTDRAD